jgi:hypothetical protein
LPLLQAHWDTVSQHSLPASYQQYENIFIKNPLKITYLPTNQNHQLNWWFAPALQGRNTDSAPEGAPKGLATALISQAAAKSGCLFLPNYSCYP